MRRESSNSFLLRSIAALADPGFTFEFATGLDELPIFSPDLEGKNTPPSVTAFAETVAASDGIVISSPEYVRAIPGGLKNAIDWLVSRPEIIKKPIALVHASHRGDDMLGSLRSVVGTVSENFCDSCFIRIPLMALSAEDMRVSVNKPENIALINKFLCDYSYYIRTVNE